MRSMSKLAVAAVGVASLASLASPALADPPNGVTPAKNSIVGVGSDTTEYFLDELALSYDATSAVRKLYSWDATGSATITPKVGAQTITRPNGSSAGISALATYPASTVDFARSSRAPKVGDPTNLLFIKFAQDAVSWAANATTNAPASLTPTQLAAIYKCQVTTWNQVGGTSSATIQPFLPQAGSGTRAFFETAIGITDADLGSCVNQTVQENEGTDPQLAGNPDAMVPYSVAKWIAQVYHSGPGQNTFGSDVHGTMKVKNINGLSPTKTNRTTGAVTINAKFVSSFLRYVYNVVRQDTTQSSGIPKYLDTIFGSTGYLCSKGSTIIKNYGFLPIGSLCGTTSHA